MTEENTTDPTTVETPNQDPPLLHITSYGDPVIVDDGGSVRITHGPVQMNGLTVAADLEHIDGNFKAPARVSVLSLTGAGPYAASVMINDGDEVVVSTDGTHNVKLKLVLTGAPPNGLGLSIKTSHVCEHHSHHNPIHYGYSRSDPSQVITKVVVNTSAGPIQLIDSRFALTRTFVCVERLMP